MKRYKTLVTYVCLLCGIFLFSGCADSSRMPTTAHIKMLSASHMNWGLVNPAVDNWDSTEWMVYYDGTAEYFDVYHLSGETRTASWQIDKDALHSLYATLMTGFMDYDEDLSSCADGSGWHIAFYDEEQNLVHEYTGYIEAWEDIEAIAPLQHIIKLLTFDYQMFYEGFSLEEATAN